MNSYHIPFGFDAVKDLSCRLSFTSHTIESSKELRDQLSVYASASGGYGGVEFSASAGYDQESETFEQSNSKKVESSATCQYFVTQMALHDKPDFSDDFKKTLNNLNQEIKSFGRVSENSINALIDAFGTHYVDHMVYGARLTRIHTMTSDAFSSMEQSGMNIEASASYSGAVSVAATVGMTQEQKQAASTFNENVQTKIYAMGKPPPADGDLNTWASEISEFPSPIKYRLKSIEDIFNPKFFPAIKTYVTKPEIVVTAIEAGRNTYCQHNKITNDHVYCKESDIPVYAPPPPPKATYGRLTWDM